MPGDLDALECKPSRGDQSSTTECELCIKMLNIRSLRKNREEGDRNEQKAVMEDTMRECTRRRMGSTIQNHPRQDRTEKARDSGSQSGNGSERALPHG